MLAVTIILSGYVNLKPRSTDQRPSCNQRFNTDNLKEPSVKNAFIFQVRNRFQSLAVLSLNLLKSTYMVIHFHREQQGMFRFKEGSKEEVNNPSNLKSH